MAAKPKSSVSATSMYKPKKKKTGSADKKHTPNKNGKYYEKPYRGQGR